MLLGNCHIVSLVVGRTERYKRLWSRYKTSQERRSALKQESDCYAVGMSQGRIVTLANTKSSEKRIRSNERKRVRNQMYRSRVKTLVRKAEEQILTGLDSVEAIRLAMSTLDKAAGKGIIHKNNAARRKSRLAAKLAKFQAMVPAAETPAKKSRASTKRTTTKSSAKPAAKA
jgi:small subunit ribosomal protein S20